MTKKELEKIAHEAVWDCIEGKKFDYSILEKLTSQELKYFNRFSKIESKKLIAMEKAEHEKFLAEWRRKARYYYNNFPIGEA